MDGKKTHTHTRPQKQYETKNKTTSCPTHVLVDVYATGSGRRVVDQRVNRRLCVQKILVLSVEPRGEVIADVLRCDLGDVLVRRNGAVVRLQEHHHFHPVMSGRSPPLYCVCVCVFSSHPFWTSSSLDVPAGVTQEEGHTGFLIHLPSAVRALIFVARRIQPFLSLVDREVEFCVLTN